MVVGGDDRGGKERGVDWWRVEIEGDEGRRCISRMEVASTCGW